LRFKPFSGKKSEEKMNLVLIQKVIDIHPNYRAMPPRKKNIMSTDYIITTPIPMSELFGERLKKYGIRDAQSPEATDDARCLTDGENNYLWAYGNPVTGFTRYMPNGWPGFILQAIATEFGVEIYSEHAL
jgi:hypothetical protein